MYRCPDISTFIEASNLIALSNHGTGFRAVLRSILGSVEASQSNSQPARGSGSSGEATCRPMIATLHRRSLELQYVQSIRSLWINGRECVRSSSEWGIFRDAVGSESRETTRLFQLLLKGLLGLFDLPKTAHEACIANVSSASADNNRVRS